MSDRMTVEQLQNRIKGLVNDAVWGGLTREIIAAILKAEAEVAQSK